MGKVVGSSKESRSPNARMHKHVASVDGPITQKNATAATFKPGLDPVKGPPKAAVKSGIASASANKNLR